MLEDFRRLQKEGAPFTKDPAEIYRQARRA
jgi:hypothetical protein